MAKRKSKKAPKLDELPGLEDPRAPIDGQALLVHARPLLESLRKDLALRAQDPGVEEALKEAWQKDRDEKRTADAFPVWCDSLIAQVAASWFLSCVFVRVLEDRGLRDQARIAGEGAMDSQRLFFQVAPSLTERDYLLFVFRELCAFPAARALFDRDRALVWKLAPSADASKELLRLFRTPNAETPALRFGQADTRFLGDLYQDLYEDVRKRYALLQTPDFVEEFILDRTLEPAIERFGLDDTDLIDPTCGSGHFLLGAFDRLFDHRLRKEPGLDVGQAAERALDAVYGADINPYAVAIARFRLTLSYLDKAQIGKLKDAPQLPLHLVVADSLLHNPHQPQLDLENQEGQSAGEWRSGDLFALEDEAAAREVLHRQFAAVVGNPPYITEKDKVKREVYRDMYSRSAGGKYALAAPFCQRFFQAARERGYVGQITANSFMKREFGKKLIRDYLPSVNLELIVNTSGAYIPGHGTPTVLLFGTHEPPVESDVHTVLAKRGEPSTPADPSKGEVWSSISDHFEELNFENDYISVAKTEREKLAEHPWSLAGGGATELKQLLEDRAEKCLGDVTASIGISSFTLEDDVFLRPADSWHRAGCPDELVRPMVIGEAIRDWSVSDVPTAFFPYTEEFEPIEDGRGELRLLWPYRTVLANNKLFGGKTKVEGGLKWYEYGRLTADKLRTPLSIAFAEVATHNHFVLDRGGKVFKQTAPIIKLPEDATEDDHLALLAYLNSSTACFWLKQMCISKGMGGNGRGITQDAWHQQYQHDGTKTGRIPLPPQSYRSRLLEYAAQLDGLANERRNNTATTVLLRSNWHTAEELQDELRLRREHDLHCLRRMVALQEELDWLVYESFGLGNFETRAPLEVEELVEGARPFEVDMARRVRSTGWFDLHGLNPVLEPERDIDRQRLEWIASVPEIRFLEDPVFKRRWRALDHAKEEAFALRSLILDRVESALSSEGAALTSAELAKHVGNEASLAALEVLQSLDDARSVPELLASEGMPYARAVVYSESGLKKADLWRRCWEAQRAEDRGELANGLVPPKFKRTDFVSGDYWALRGKLDVPKERFISYPGCESDEDKEPVYGWAGWNHLQRAQALASLYQKRKTDEGWEKDRLTPMLAGLLELIPWVKQWHNEPNDEFGGLKMGDYFEQFLDGECQAWGLSREELEAWRPPKKTKKRASKKPAKAKSDSAEPAAKKPRKKTSKRAARETQL